MTRNTRPELDKLLEQARAQEPDDAQISDAAARVWKKLAAEAARPAHGAAALEGCADYRSHLPSYLERTLSPALQTLVEAHVHDCLACRRAVNALRDGARAALPGRERGLEAAEPGGIAAHRPQGTRRGLTGRRLALVAGVVVVAGVSAVGALTGVWDGQAPVGSVASIEGTLLELGPDGLRPLAAGAPVLEDTPLRTARGSQAVITLTDGTRVELRERSELEVQERRAGITLELNRGNALVNAADQLERPLRLRTPDCDVAVTGTIFSVLTGLKGSRVSVIEGVVQVSRADTVTTLQAGEQLSTSSSIARVPVASEVAWSGEAAAYRAVLAGLGKVDRASLKGASTLRYETALLDAMPDTTAVFMAIPNLGSQVGEAWTVLSSRIQESEGLQRLWQEKAVAAGVDEDLEELLDTLKGLGEALGDEVAVSLQATEEGRLDGVLLLAQVRDEPALRSLLGRLADTAATADGPAVRLIERGSSLSTQDGDREVIRVSFIDGMVALSTAPRPLEQLLTVRTRGLPGPFERTAFHDRIADAYADGTDWLLAADLGLLSTGITADDPANADLLQDLGLLDADYLIAEHRTDGEGYHAALTFDQKRRGLAAWLDAPAPLAGLDFVSPEATVAAGLVVRSPAVLLSEMLEVLERHRARGQTGAARPEETRIEEARRLRFMDEVAGALGGEVVVALDGPLLPTPAWKVVFEVYDEAALQRVIRETVEQINAEAARNPEAPQLTLEERRVGGRTFHALRVKATNDFSAAPEIHYVFVDGYAIAAPGRVLLERAIGYRDTANTLTRSATFRSLLPVDGHANFSALLYHDVEPLVGAVSQTLGELKPLLAEATGPHGDALSGVIRPQLVGIYGEPDRITLAGRGNGPDSDSDLSTLTQLGQVLLGMVDRAASNPETATSGSTMP